LKIDVTENLLVLSPDPMDCDNCCENAGERKPGVFTKTMADKHSYYYGAKVVEAGQKSGIPNTPNLWWTANL